MQQRTQGNIESVWIGLIELLYWHKHL